MTKREIQYVKGDLFAAIAEVKAPILIPHICNDKGRWGAGFVVPLGKHFPVVQEAYLKWAKSGGIADFRCGKVQYKKATEDGRIVVANMVSQHDTAPDEYGRPPIRYAALAECMKEVAAWMAFSAGPGAEIHTVKFGAGLAGGNWDFIEALIIELWIHNDLSEVGGNPVTVYVLE